MCVCASEWCSLFQSVSFLACSGKMQFDVYLIHGIHGDIIHDSLVFSQFTFNDNRIKDFMYLCRVIWNSKLEWLNALRASVIDLSILCLSPPSSIYYYSIYGGRFHYIASLQIVCINYYIYLSHLAYSNSQMQWAVLHCVVLCSLMFIQLLSKLKMSFDSNGHRAICSFL